jgi:hypothetical protein
VQRDNAAGPDLAGVVVLVNVAPEAGDLPRGHHLLDRRACQWMPDSPERFGVPGA